MIWDYCSRRRPSSPPAWSPGTVNPYRLSKTDQRLILLILLAAAGTYYLQRFWLNPLQLPTSLSLRSRDLSLLGITLLTFSGLLLMAPLLINFARSRFALPWSLLALAILTIPWLQGFPLLHFPVVLLWLYAALVYLLLGALAQFGRQASVDLPVAVFSERERLIVGFNQFLQAFFAGYETVFGGRGCSGSRRNCTRSAPSTRRPAF
jgi:hypothetical protein